MEGFVDIHCHILPGLDDGPENIDDSLQMLEIAKRDGIVSVVATPHIKEGVYDTVVSDIKEGVALLREKTDVPEIFVGADVRISYSLIDKIKEGRIPLINNRKFLLLELPTFSIPSTDYLSKLFFALRHLNVYPVITHPERNIMFLEHAGILQRLIGHGAYCQVTAMSITGHFGKEIQRFTRELFKKGLVHVVATDAHSPKDRPPVLSSAYQQVSKLVGEETARKVFIVNPQRILEGLMID